MNKYSKEIVEVVKQFLDKDDWTYDFDEEHGIFTFGLKIDSKLRTIRYIVDVKEDEVLVYGVSPIYAEPEDASMMMNMSEFICRANYGMRNGCFEMDHRDGEIRFKSFVDCEDVMPSPAVISNSIHCTAAMFEHYGDGIKDVIFAGASGEDAVEACESVPEQLLELLSDLEEEGLDDELLEAISQLAEKLGVANEDSSSDSDSVAS